MSTALPDQLKWEYSAFPVQISQKQRLSPGFMRITVTGDKLRFFGQWGLDQRIKLIIPSPAGNIPDFGILDEPTPPPTTWLPRAKSFPADQRPILRTYTPSAVRPELCEVDIDIYLHNPSGPVVCDQLFVGRLSSKTRPSQRLVSCQKSTENQPPPTHQVASLHRMLRH